MPGSSRSLPRRLLLHDLAVSARQVAPALGVFLVVFLLLGAVSTAAIPDTSVFSGAYTHNQLKFRLWDDGLTYLVVMTAVALGVCLAFVQFKFLTIRMQTTLYLSLPLRRRTLYLVRVLTACVGMVLTLAVALGVSFALNVLALGYWQGEALQVVYVLVGLLAGACVGYALTLVALLLSGTQVEALLSALALIVAVSVFCWGSNALMTELLVGNAAGEYLLGTQTPVAASLLTRFSSCNPLLFFVQAAAAHQVFWVQPPVYAPALPDWSLPAAWLLFDAAVLFAGELLLERRRGEQAGIAGLCTALTFVFCLVCGFLVFSVAFKLVAPTSVPAAVALGITALAVVVLLLLRGPLRGRAGLASCCALTGAEALVIVVAVALTATGALGWSSVVPASDEVSRVRVSYTGASSLFGGQLESATSGSTGLYMSGTYTYDEARAIEVVTTAQRELIGAAHGALATNPDDFSATVVPYDVQIEYTLQDGTRLVRYYERARLSTLAQLAALDDTEHAAQVRAALALASSKELEEDELAVVKASAAGQALAYGALYLSNPYLAQPVAVDCTAKARQGLMRALAKDLAAQGSANRYHCDAPCRAVLLFSLEGQADAQAFATQVGNSLIYVTDDFTHTLKWLKGKGLMKSLGLDAGFCRQMVVVRYDPYAAGGQVAPRSPYFTAYRSTSGDDFVSAPEYGSRLAIDDTQQLEELVPLLRTDYYLDGGGYLVSVALEGQSAYSYLFLPAASAPEWLQQQAG